MSKYLRKVTEPVAAKKGQAVAELLTGMGNTAFQGKNMAVARDIWQKMFKQETTIFLGLAGAMVPAGMRRLIAQLVEKRAVDCLVSTGANLFHDIHESLGRYHWQGSPHVDDAALFKAGIDRIYDVFASEQDFRKTDNWITQFSATLNQDKLYTTREFFYLLGKKLTRDAKEGGILTAAAQKNVPVYCPALGDSSIGIALADGLVRGKSNIKFDIIKDIVETAEIARFSKKTGVVYVGGGTPKNFIQQTEVTISIFGFEGRGHDFAIQITSDSPQWGGLSGCTFEEAQSWGKIAEGAAMVTLNADATIALPILVQALVDKGIKRRAKPIIKFSKGKVDIKYA